MTSIDVLGYCFQGLPSVRRSASVVDEERRRSNRVACFPYLKVPDKGHPLLASLEARRTKKLYRLKVNGSMMTRVFLEGSASMQSSLLFLWQQLCPPADLPSFYPVFLPACMLCFAVSEERWIEFDSPVLSIRAVVLMVSPKSWNRDLSPRKIPAVTGPLWRPTRIDKSAVSGPSVISSFFVREACPYDGVILSRSG
jgi:hypothetical protein